MSEIEIKLTVTAEDFAALKATPEFRELFGRPLSNGSLEATYYDTPKFDLRDSGLTLRVRRDGDHFVQTVKSVPQQSASAIERNEWEHILPGGQLDLNALPDAAQAAFTERV